MLKTLLKPHKCYMNEVIEYVRKYEYDSLHAMCHITGGGLFQNLKRVIPNNLSFELYDIVFPDWCNYISKQGNINKEEMMDVFNCGIGFVLIIDKNAYNSLKLSNSLSFETELIGEIV